MTNVVERLREVADYFAGHGVDRRALLREAAAEIERGREHIKQLLWLAGGDERRDEQFSPIRMAARAFLDRYPNPTSPKQFGHLPEDCHIVGCTDPYHDEYPIDTPNARSDQARLP